jgi:hypothetical protein
MIISISTERQYARCHNLILMLDIVVSVVLVRAFLEHYTLNVIFFVNYKWVH